MARWKILVAHYLETRDTDWEYTETDRVTGRPLRRRIPVPRLVDPKDANCWTNRWGSKDMPEGECILCYEGKGEKGDITFYGDPTPDMIPVDDEAQAISNTYAERWRYKPETHTPNEYNQSLIDTMQKDMAALANKPAQVEGMAELVAAMTEQSKVLQALVASQQPRKLL